MSAALPFKQTTHGGFADVVGLLRLDEQTLSVEFEVMDAISGLLRSKHDVQIGLEQLDDVTFKKGLFTATLWIRVKDMDTIERIPWRQGAEFAVKIRRRDREIAEHFSEECGWLVK